MYQPKGGMCAGCTYRFLDCSDLKFSDMQPIEITPVTIIVKCTKYLRDMNLIKKEESK